MNKIVKNALVLMAFSLVLGFVLGAVYKITEEPIAEANRKKEMAAYKVVFENADDFKEIANFDANAANAIIADYPDTVNGALEAVDASGNVIGHVITLTTKDGYGGGIVLTVGIQNDGTVNGFSVVSYGGETIYKAFEPAFADQFAGKSCESYVVTKATPAADNEIQAITGSTITSDAVTGGVNTGLAYYRELLNITGGELK